MSIYQKKQQEIQKKDHADKNYLKTYLINLLRNALILIR